MSTLKFNKADVLRVVAHARAATDWQTPYYDKKWKKRPCVLLVHDDGVYLMSGGLPRDIVNGQVNFCAYAEGTGPDDPDNWDVARDLVGGDDFVEYLADDFLDKIEAQAKSAKRKEVVIELTEETLEVPA